jgi:hypothetical protein
MPAHGGKRPGAGRKAGTPNKLNAQAKENLAEAFRRIGGVKTLAKWAEDNQTEFFKLYARLLPVEGPGDSGEHTLQIVHKVE